ncbi:septal ring lytic transglycosylase RlpA family protein [Nitrosomonas sp.]|uniref:septal ring lytic transglycosylase RlpA family protein n=1 Tax=Nitrosomonas sp. TaxID=42353 RepID=UPI0033056C19
MKINFDFCFTVTDKNTLFALLVIMVALMVSACSNTPRLGQSSHSPVKTGGGYYLDDGPERDPPSNLDSISDAVPRIEPLKTTTMRPYVALGKTYTPMTSLKPYKAHGHASWYGKRYHGKRTASGEVYDMYSMTAAHPTLPIPSYVRVTNLQNGSSVVVRINDRGPFLENRLIDLSYVAAYKLGVLADGSARVEVESIIPGRFGSADPPVMTRKQTSGESKVASSKDNGKFYLQLAAFESAHNAQSYLTQLRSEFPSITQQTRINQTSGLHKILVGPFPNLEAANRTANIITTAGSPEPILVQHTY